GTGIKPTTQEYAQRNITSEMDSNRLREQLRELFNTVCLLELVIWRCNIELPVLCNPWFLVPSTQIEEQAISRHQFVDAFKHRLVGREIAQGKEFREGATVEAGLESRKFKQGLDFRSKCKAIPELRVIERLDSQSVARAEQSFAAGIPDGKGEHSAQMVDAVL